jgi:hypothetical protein
MKARFTLFCLMLGLLLTSCSMTSIEYDYDRDFDYSTLKLYEWMDVPADFPANEIVIQRIKRAVDQQMQQKGFEQTTTSPDFYISMQGFVDIIREGVERGVAYRGYRGYDRTYERRFEVYEYREGTIALTIINAKTNTLIWEGSATRALDDNPSVETREKTANEVAAKLLSEFPPTSKK